MGFSSHLWPIGLINKVYCYDILLSVYVAKIYLFKLKLSHKIFFVFFFLFFLGEGLNFSMVQTLPGDIPSTYHLFKGTRVLFVLIVNEKALPLKPNLINVVVWP